MVTLAEIDLVHERLGKADTLVAYCQALAELGVTGYDSYVVDGRTAFRTADGDELVTPAHHDLVDIAAEPDHAECTPLLRGPRQARSATSRCLSCLAPPASSDGRSTLSDSP